MRDLYKGGASAIVAVVTGYFLFFGHAGSGDESPPLDRAAVQVGSRFLRAWVEEGDTETALSLSEDDAEFMVRNDISEGSFAGGRIGSGRIASDCGQRLPSGPYPSGGCAVFPYSDTQAGALPRGSKVKLRGRWFVWLDKAGESWTVREAAYAGGFSQDVPKE